MSRHGARPTTAAGDSWMKWSDPLLYGSLEQPRRALDYWLAAILVWILAAMDGVLAAMVVNAL